MPLGKMKNLTTVISLIIGFASPFTASAHATSSMLRPNDDHQLATSIVWVTPTWNLDGIFSAAAETSSAPRDKADIGVKDIVSPARPKFSMSTSSNKPPTEVVEGGIATASCGVVTITQNVPDDTTITTGNTVSCNAAGVNADNFYARNYSIAAPVLVQCIDFAVQINNIGPYNVRVRMYTHPTPGTPVTANLTLIPGSEQQVSIPASTTNTFFTATYPGSGILVPAGNLVVELFTPTRLVSEGGDGGSIFLGSNNLGQTGPTYIKAADCGVSDYVDLAGLGFPNVHILQRLGVQPGCGSQPPCNTPQFCTFDGIPNIAQGQAALFLNNECHLEVLNIGSSGQDGVTQSPLPPNSTKMVTGLDVPNFGASIVGTKAVFNMFADNQLLSTLTIENIADGVVQAQGDFSPAGATMYRVKLFVGNQVVGDFFPLPQAVTIMHKNDLVAVDCKIDPQCEITYELVDPRPVTVVGGGTVTADGLALIALDPAVHHTAQTAIENFFTNTGTIEMTYQFAGPSVCGEPGAGSCATPHPTPGCISLLCCGAVCSVDPFCCQVQWDVICVNEAGSLCANLPVCGNGLCENGEDATNCPADCGPACVGDITGDGLVNVSDLLSVINSWGPCPQPCPPHCPADIAPPGGDCVVNTSDLLVVINHWGPCGP